MTIQAYEKAQLIPQAITNLGFTGSVEVFGDGSIVWHTARPANITDSAIAAEVENLLMSKHYKATQTATLEAAKAALIAIDLASIRAIREWIISQPTAPQLLKDRDATAALERAKIK